MVEVKSVVPDNQAMLHGLDRKVRLAPLIAAERGWVRRVTSVGCWSSPRDRPRGDGSRARGDVPVGAAGPRAGRPGVAASPGRLAARAPVLAIQRPGRALDGLRRASPEFGGANRWATERIVAICSPRRLMTGTGGGGRAGPWLRRVRGANDERAAVVQARGARRRYAASGARRARPEAQVRGRRRRYAATGTGRGKRRMARGPRPAAQVRGTGTIGATSLEVARNPPD